MDKRDLLLGGAMTAFGVAAGSFYGGVLATAALPGFYWPSVVAFVLAGVVSLLFWAGFGLREDRFHKSPALELIFDASDPACTYELQTPSTALAGTPPIFIPGIGLVMTGSLRDATDVRLRVTNLRPRRLSRVRVRVENVRDANGEVSGFPASWLHWMHDDTAAYYESFGGKQIEPGAGDHVDLAMQVHGQPEFVLYYAVDHLRLRPLRGDFNYVDVVASGEDEATSRPVPDRHRTFVVGVGADLRLSVRDGG
jgi:hypothetical protein